MGDMGTALGYRGVERGYFIDGSEMMGGVLLAAVVPSILSSPAKHLFLNPEKGAAADPSRGSRDQARIPTGLQGPLAFAEVPAPVSQDLNSRTIRVNAGPGAPDPGVMTRAAQEV